MRKFALIPLMVALSACSMMAEPPKEKADLSDGYGVAPTSEINHLSQRLVNDLVRQNDSLKPTQPILVMTPVMLRDLKQTNGLGLQLQQGMISALHAHQFSLVDINVAEMVKVTSKGELLLSRNWEELPSDLPVEFALVSTMDFTLTGVVVNARIVNVTNNRVISAAQTSVKQEELKAYLAKSERVISSDGLLYRYEDKGMHQVQPVGEGL